MDKKGFSLKPKNPKRVQWLPPPFLCQVKTFMVDDSPSEISSNPENLHQRNISLTGQCDGPPPGFGNRRLKGILKQTCFPTVKWKPPPKFILNKDWCVGAGEQSEEKKTQKHREISVLEAHYPHASSIPSCPLTPSRLEEGDYDDRQTPCIPIISIEDQKAVDDKGPSIPEPKLTINEKSGRVSNSVVDEVQLKSAQHNNRDKSKLTINENSGRVSTGLETDAHATASAALTEFLKSNDKGNLIDTDLLIKFLNNPNMVEKLTIESGASSSMINLVDELESANNSATDPKPIVSVISAPAAAAAASIQCLGTMAEKSMYVSSNIQNLAPHTWQSAASTFSSSSSKTEFPSVSSVFPSDIINTERPVSGLEFPEKVPSISSYFSRSGGNHPPTPMVPTPTFGSRFVDMPSLGRETPQPSLERDAMALSSNPGNYRPEMVPTLSSHFARSTDMPSLGRETPQPSLQRDAFNLSSNLDKYRSEMVPALSSYFARFNDMPSSGRETFQPSLQSNGIALPTNPGNYRPEMFTPICRQNQCLPQEHHSLGSFLQYSSSTSTGPSVYPISSATTPVVKDRSYYKSLIDKHGVERPVVPEEYVPQYMSKASEFIRVSGEGEAQTKIPKQCRYFNSSKGCRNGASCPFQHDALLKIRAGSLPDDRASKRIKLSR